MKALTESFAYEVPEVQVLEPGELKRIAEAPARFAVLDPGELKALMESGTRPNSQGDSTTVVDSEGVGWSGIGVASLIFLPAVGAAVSFICWRPTTSPGLDKDPSSERPPGTGGLFSSTVLRS